eukprot:g14809.t1
MLKQDLLQAASDHLMTTWHRLGFQVEKFCGRIKDSNVVRPRIGEVEVHRRCTSRGKEGFEKIQGDSMSGCRVEGLWKELPEAGTRKTAQPPLWLCRSPRLRFTGPGQVGLITCGFCYWLRCWLYAFASASFYSRLPRQTLQLQRQILLGDVRCAFLGLPSVPNGNSHSLQILHDGLHVEFAADGQAL